MSTPGDTVIDLGVYHRDAADHPDPWSPWPGPFWQRIRQRLRRPELRRGLPVALVAMLVWGLGGAAAPAQPPLVPLWTVPGGAVQRYAVGEQDLYLLAAAGPEWTLTAHRLADGAVRWVSPVENPGDWAIITVAGGLPVTTAPRPGSIEVATGYDPASGQPRWSHRGWPLGTAAGGRLLLARPLPAAWPVDDGTVPGDGEHPYYLDVVDLRTGELGWTRRFSVGQVVLDPQPAVEHLVTVDRAGRLTSYDLATGEVLPSPGSVPRSRGCPADDRPPGHESCQLLPAAPAGWHPLDSPDGTRWLLGRAEEPSRAEHGSGRYWLAWWHPDPPSLTVLGAIDAPWCAPPAGPHFVCETASTEDLQVWGLR